MIEKQGFKRTRQTGTNYRPRYKYIFTTKEETAATRAEKNLK